MQRNPANPQIKCWNIYPAIYALDTWSFQKVCVDAAQLCKACIESQSIARVFRFFKTTLVNARSYAANYASRYSGISSSYFLLFYSSATSCPSETWPHFPTFTSSQSRTIPTQLIKRRDTYSTIYLLRLSLRFYALRSLHQSSNKFLPSSVTSSATIHRAS